MEHIKYSELTFHLMVEMSPTALVLVNKDGLIVYANVKTKDLFGYTMEEMIGKTVELLIPQRYHENHVKYRTKFVTTPQVRSIGAGRDLYAVRKNGTEFPVEIGLNPVIVVDSTLILASIIDITERKHLEARFKQVVEHSLTAMILVNSNGDIILANKQTELFSGYTHEELIGHRIEMLLPERYRARHEQYRVQYLKNATVRPMGIGRELYGLHKNGTEIPIEIGLNPIVESNGDIVILTSIIDITERKQKDTDIRNKINFMINTSHELRTPISAVLGLSELLLDGTYGILNIEQIDCITRIYDSEKYLLQLVNNVLDISKIDSDQPLFNPVNFDIHEIITETLKTVDNLIVAAGLTVQCHFSKDLHTVYLDKNRFVQILYNLLSNAIKYNKPAGRIIICTELNIGNDTFTLNVSDTGIGIAKDDIPKLFTPFVQLNVNKGGTGLGLAIVKKLVQKQGGSISVRSVLGEGSTFTVLLPMKIEPPLTAPLPSAEIFKGTY